MESELVQYLKEKEARDVERQKIKDCWKIGFLSAGLALTPVLLPKGDGEW